MRVDDFYEWMNQKETKEKFREYLWETYGKMDWRASIEAMGYNICLLSSEINNLKQKLKELTYEEMDV